MIETYDLIRFMGDTRANVDYHHGQLRPAVGVHSYQVLRATRSRPELAEAYGWTYNHAPMLAYCHERFYVAYLSNPVDEHTPPGQTLLASSSDGRTWDRPRVIFPPYIIPMGVYPDDLPHKLEPNSYAVMHQRMAFFIAPNGRLLVMGFYGICPHSLATSPLDGRGVGRAVREVYEDNSLGPIYFVRYNRHAGWNESNTSYPFCETSPDKGFVEACDALLADKLVTLQWWEEDRAEDGFFATRGREAFCFYHTPDGNVVGLWKWSHAALSTDEGQSWSEIQRMPSLVMAGAKVWGQRTSDGRYALVYNPSPSNEHRWPLAIVTGEDGYSYNNMLLVQGEVPPRRYAGQWKDDGPQYNRGIVEGNGTPPDGAMWITYSMNKEDIWVSRIPVPIIGQVEGPVSDTLDRDAALVSWTIYSPLWAQVGIDEAPGGGHALALRDKDPFDYAKAERIFPDSTVVTIRTRVMAGQTEGEPLHINVADEKGQVPVRIWFDVDGRLRAIDASVERDLGPYEAGQWYDLTLKIDMRWHHYHLTVSGTDISRTMRFGASAATVHRVAFQTGPIRRTPQPWMPTEGGLELPTGDNPISPSVFYVANLTTEDHSVA